MAGDIPIVLKIRVGDNELLKTFSTEIFNTAYTLKHAFATKNTDLAKSSISYFGSRVFDLIEYVLRMSSPILKKMLRALNFCSTEDDDEDDEEDAEMNDGGEEDDNALGFFGRIIESICVAITPVARFSTWALQGVSTQVANHYLWGYGSEKHVRTVTKAARLLIARFFDRKCPKIDRGKAQPGTPAPKRRGRCLECKAILLSASPADTRSDIVSKANDCFRAYASTFNDASNTDDPGENKILRRIRAQKKMKIHRL
jgi:hypothetical protein